MVVGIAALIVDTVMLPLDHSEGFGLRSNSPRAPCLKQGYTWNQNKKEFDWVGSLTAVSSIAKPLVQDTITRNPSFLNMQLRFKILNGNPVIRLPPGHLVHPPTRKSRCGREVGVLQSCFRIAKHMAAAMMLLHLLIRL